jgi:hypothetical protein
MFKALILFMGLHFSSLSIEEKDAIKNYKEFGTRCVPQRLKDSTIKVEYKDSTYTMSPDLNGILWVKEMATAN